MFECPNSIEELEEWERKLPMCRISLFETAKAKVDTGVAVGLRDASRQIGEETGGNPESIKRAILREQQTQGITIGGDSVPTKPHVAQSTGNNEWYTPDVFIEAVKGVMGNIDLDPASSDIANQTVKAKTFFTKEEDGLSQPWTGRIFLNPPYAQPLIQQFSDKLCSVWGAGKIKEAIILVNNATETLWFQNIAVQASTVCFVRSRVRFLDIEGNPGAPLQGQAILYLGNKITPFYHHFNRFGVILKGV